MSEGRLFLRLNDGSSLLNVCDRPASLCAVTQWQSYDTVTHQSCFGPSLLFRSIVPFAACSLRCTVNANTCLLFVATGHFALFCMSCVAGSWFQTLRDLIFSPL